VDVQAHEPPRRRAEAVRRRLGDAGEALAATLDELDRLRYGAGSAAGIPRGWWRRFGAAADAARGAP
jgi:hypothetical protein